MDKLHETMGHVGSSPDRPSGQMLRVVVHAAPLFHSVQRLSKSAAEQAEARFRARVRIASSKAKVSGCSCRA